MTFRLLSIAKFVQELIINGYASCMECVIGHADNWNRSDMRRRQAEQFLRIKYIVKNKCDIDS